jgi:hypothetical protein
MGDNLGIGRGKADTGKEEEQSNKWGDKAHLRVPAPLPSGTYIAKIKSATGNTY